jgi:hypothetical protein
MTLPDLAQRVVHGDVVLTWQGETLHVNALKGTLTPALKQTLVEYKPSAPIAGSPPR